MPEADQVTLSRLSFLVGLLAVWLLGLTILVARLWLEAR